MKNKIFSFIQILSLIGVTLPLAFISAPPKVGAATQKVIFLTSGTSWTVPSDWNDNNNSIEVIGGGGGGLTQTASNYGGGGGGGGYSKIENASLSRGATITIQIGVGGGAGVAGGDTYLCNNISNCDSIGGSAVLVGAQGGGVATNNGVTGGLGGLASNGVGSVRYSGGNGGSGSGSFASGGGGGGGSAGPNGDGAAGGAAASEASGGGGGGGANGGSGGVAGSGANGSLGGNNRTTAGGGAAGSPDGGLGSDGGGGGGGDGLTNPGGNGGSGGVDLLWIQTSNSLTAGPAGGGGGGGRGAGSSSGGSGGSGGVYGGGGGGGGYSDGTLGVGGAGGGGLVIITYSPIERFLIARPHNRLGLVGYWSFDEGAGTVATDFSGQGKHGALDADATWATGKRGTAITLDGTLDNVDIPTIDAGTVNSASLWVDFRDSGDAVLLGRGGNSGNGLGYFFYVDQTDVYYSPVAGTFAQVAHGGLSPGQWNHLAVVRNGTSVTFYKNGVQLGSPQTLANNSALDGVVSIGSYGDTTLALDGRLDEVRIYTRALSASEVAVLYGSGAVKFTASSVELTRGTSLANGLVAHWTFDGPDVTTTIRDRSGNGHNAYFIGGATSSAKTIGKLGQALNFDGVDDYASSTNITALNNIPQMTISAWTKADVMPGPSTWQIIVSKMSASPSWYFGFVDVGSPLIYFVHDNSAGTAVTADISSIHKTGVWEHWVVVYNGPQSTASIYLNGVEITNSDPGGLGTVRSNSDPVRIGVLSPGAYHFDGSLDDVRLYNRALSASEVKQLYNLGAARIVQ